MRVALRNTASTARRARVRGLCTGHRGDVRVQLLDKSLDYVNELGWNEKAMETAVEELGFSWTILGMIRRGPFEIVDRYMTTRNAMLREKMDTLEKEDLRTTAIVRKGIQMRLEMQIPYMIRWHEAMALGGLPQNIADTTVNLADIADTIWIAAGDKSTDYNYYTKRLLLGGVYTSTELYMLSDKSLNYEQTWGFLDRRLQDVLHLGRLPSDLKKMAVDGGSSILGSMMNAASQRPPRRGE